MTRLAKTGWACAVLIVGLLLGAPDSMAQSPAQRHIVLNGQYLDALNVAALDYLNCGRPVPNGRYWVNWVQRTWGYEGGPAQGRLQDCTRGAGQKVPSANRLRPLCRGPHFRALRGEHHPESGVPIVVAS